MILQLLYPYMKFSLGTLYPAYKTWKALKRKDETTRRRWMKYWVSFGAFQMFELVADLTIAYIVPFYIELKLLTIIWIITGTKLIFDTIVNRELTKREKSIDKCLREMKRVRDELVATIWYEVSRCSINVVTTIMTSSLNLLVRPELKSNSDEEPSSPVKSEICVPMEEDMCT